MDGVRQQEDGVTTWSNEWHRVTKKETTLFMATSNTTKSVAKTASSKKPSTHADHGMATAEGVKEGKRAKVLAHIAVHHAENGGHIIRHHFDNSGPGYGYNDPEEYVFGAEEGEKAMAHVAQHTGMKPPAKPTVVGGKPKPKDKLEPGS